MKLIVLLISVLNAQRTVKSQRCPGPDWELLLDPGTHCYKKLPHGYPWHMMEGQCRKQAPNARPVLPTSDRENELIVKMMNNTKGVWIHAKRDGKLIKGMKSSSRLKYNRMSAQTRRLISRPRNERRINQI